MPCWRSDPLRFLSGRRLAVAAFLSLLTGASVTPATAQPPFARGGAERPEHVEMLRMWRLVDELEISEAQAVRVFPAFRAHRAEMDSLSQKRRVLQSALAEQLEAGADDDELLASMATLSAVDDEVEALKARFRTDLGELLTVRQRAKLLLFDATFRSDLMDVVRRLRDVGRGGPPGAPGRP
jgi:Spy/CpxP family protein refolding chaperone